MSDTVLPTESGAPAGPARPRTSPVGLPWPPRDAPAEDRVEAVLSRLTLDEKLALMGGCPTVHHALVPGVPRLGVPPLRFSDGPAGLRLDGATAYPAPLALAASWDPELAGEYGTGLGRECRAQGVNALLAPMVNIIRVYHAGRSAESFSEDPYLTARIAVPVVRGVQAQRVLAVAKHFALYNQESGRLHLSAQVSDRALHEIYLPAFEAVVREARVGAVMAAYNKIAGTYASEHAGLLVDELRTRMGFTGFVLSDWEATHSLAAVTSGLSMELPLSRYHDEPLRAALDTGRLGLGVVDDHVRRILRSMADVGLLGAGPLDSTPADPVTDAPVEPVPGLPAGTAGGRADDDWTATARRIAERGAVLLKNDRNTLPLDPTALGSVAVIGATAHPAAHGYGGSAWVPGRNWVSVLDGLREALGDGVRIRHVMAQPVPFLDGRPTLDAMLLTPVPTEPASAASTASTMDTVETVDTVATQEPGAGRYGLVAEYFDNADLAGEPALVRVEDRACGSWHFDRPDPSLPERYSVRWTAALRVPSTGRYTLGVEGFGPCELYLDDELVADGSTGDAMLCVGTGEVTLEQGRDYRLRISYRHERGWLAGVRAFWEPPSRVRHPDIERAAAAAAECDVAVVVVGTFQTEGFDRPTLSLAGAQDALVEAVVAANPRTVVVLATGGPVLLPWIDRVPAVIEAWYGGEQAGTALAGLLTGAVNPSGRLPVSFPRSAREVPTVDPRRFPGVDSKVDYSEDLLVGYRWYDATGNAALFPFGHGLSYTTFDYGDLRVSDDPVTVGRPLDISVAVTNTGDRPGAELVQLYVGAAHALDGPPRQLRGFRRIELEPGQTCRASFTLTQRDFCQWSTEAGNWVAPAGQYRVFVGRSSADLPQRATVLVESGAGPCGVTLDAPADVSLGAGFTLSATVANLGPGEVTDVEVEVELPAGWSAETTAPAPAAIPGGGAATASWLARAPGRGRTGPALLRVSTRYLADREPVLAESTARVMASYPRLSASFDNIGIGHAESDHADFCGTGTAYLGPALARAGLLPGRTVTCGELYFTWPRIDRGQPDNTVADGQRVPIACAGKVLAFLGAASGGTATGVGTVSYVDGATHPFAVTMPDWLANHALPSSQVVATVDQYRREGAMPRRSVSLYAVAVPLLSGRAVAAFTLPVLTEPGVNAGVRMHVFGVSIC
ncbi:MAG TPA: glycoside hydrolase family 3 C-terminal domain-containing protein [Mycobacteriales bacterium]|nr:glycoside hydrolase family 3 C-terminal domain-containing protein [Mycobacteriales bacterium]